MSEYLIAEDKGRFLFKQFAEQSPAITKYEFSEDPYKHYDCIIEMGNKRIAVEIKVRDIKYKDYDTHLMELYKSIKLMEAKVNERFDKVLYCCFFGDTLYIYDLDNVGYTVSNIYCGRTTVYNTGFTDKCMINLDKKYTQVFKNINNKWIKI